MNADQATGEEAHVEHLLGEAKPSVTIDIKEVVEGDDEGGDDDDDDDGDRGKWSRKSEYILSLIGFSVGLGNVWRFPYLCMRNGGGAFLIPFVVSLVLCALPVFFLETALGQFQGKSVYHVWNICPLFKGIGICMNVLCVFVSWYYSMILAWCCIYLVHAFKSPLPWTLCNQTWNTPACMETSDVTLTLANGPLADVNSTVSPTMSYSENETEVLTTSVTRVSASEEFWL